jgi:hypothetical protein
MFLPQGITASLQHHNSSEDTADKVVYVLQLLSSLYGLMSAPHRWNVKFTSSLLDIGLQQSLVDPCLFFNHEIIAIVWVDDCRLFGLPSNCTKYTQLLRSKFNIKVQSPTDVYLGQHWNYNAATKICAIDQHTYIMDMLKSAHMDNSRPLSTPAMPGALLESHLTEERNPAYLTHVGKLLYMLNTRPDCSFAVHQITQHNIRNGQSHFNAIKHVYRYLVGTASQPLLLKGANTLDDLHIVVYSDASWAPGPDRKSTSGWIVFVNDQPVSWGSRKQSIIAMSSMEAELIAIMTAIQEGIHLQQLCEELGIAHRTIVVYTDSQSLIALLERGPGSLNRSRHISVRMLKIQELVRSGIINIQFVSGHDNVADIFTKPLPKPAFNRHANTILQRN